MKPSFPTAEQRRRKRLRGRGSLYLGRIGGTELFLPWLDWLVSFALLGLMLAAMMGLDRSMERAGGFALVGYLGAAVMIQSALYILGTLGAALVLRLRIASLQLGPARRTGRFVTYANRGRTMTLFYPLRSLPTLLGYVAANAVWQGGGSPLFAVVAQICLLSVAFALLPIPGSDGVRTLQSIAWWLTGSVARAVRWGGIAALVVCLAGAWFAYQRVTQTTAGADGLIWLLATFYLATGVLSHLSALSTARKFEAVDAASLESLAKPMVLAAPGTRTGDYPSPSVAFLTDGARLLGQVDETAPPDTPVEDRLRPCPALPIPVDPQASVAEAYLGMFDEGCDAVALAGPGGNYAALTLLDCAAFLTARGIPYEAHLSVG